MGLVKVFHPFLTDLRHVFYGNGDAMKDIFNSHQQERKCHHVQA